MTRAVQVTADVATWDEAYAVLRGQEQQAGYLAGRMLPRAEAWFVQTFHEEAPAGAWLPDGCRHVLIPAGLAASLGLGVKSMSNVHEGADIIDSRDVIARIEELEGERDLYEEEREENEQSEALPWAEEEPDEAEELAALKALADEAEGSADWIHGEALIADSYFETYARDLAEDIGAVVRTDQWPGRCIDWKQAAEELQQDYMSVTFGSTEYWIRA